MRDETSEMIHGDRMDIGMNSAAPRRRDHLNTLLKRSRHSPSLLYVLEAAGKKTDRTGSLIRAEGP
tara:strand:- start:9 stop:206 length:198 start_codon:yes stop_codon:yes gene_type:complete